MMNDFYHLFYHMKDGAAIYQPVDNLTDFVVVDMNDAGQKISNIPREEVIGKRLSEVFPASKEMGLFQVLQEVASSGDTRVLPFRNYKDDKLDQWLENYVFKLPSGLIAAVFSDQSTLIRLRDNEQRLRIINQISSDYSYCHVLRKDGSMEPLWHIGSLEHVTGYKPEEFYPEGGWKELVHPDDISAVENYSEQLLSGREASFRARIITRSGEYRWIENKGRPWFDEVSGGLIGTYGCVLDINEQKKTERKNELLLKELNHRVKNNLLMVSSLIRLKNAELGDAADISDLAGRIDAISLIHQNLEQNNSISSVNLKSYIEQLVYSAFSTVVNFEVEKSTDINDIQYPTRKVVTLGLIINELATNAIKYGFRKGEKARFSVVQKNTGNAEFLAFEVSNSGNEFTDDIDFENSGGFGLKLIHSLIEQLGGSIELIKKPQTTFLITVPA